MIPCSTEMNPQETDYISCFVMSASELDGRDLSNLVWVL